MGLVYKEHAAVHTFVYCGFEKIEFLHVGPDVDLFRFRVGRIAVAVMDFIRGLLPYDLISIPIEGMGFDMREVAPHR